MDDNYKYFAFISYKREDEEWAIWLQHEMEHYQLPDNLKNRGDLPKEFRPVFRDVDELSAGKLPGKITNALESSAHLIVVCSPRAVSSEWVNKEITDFIEIGNNKGVDNFERVFLLSLKEHLMHKMRHKDVSRKCYVTSLKKTIL